MLGLLVNTFDLTPERFWRLVTWCQARGANEFYVTAWGFDPERVEALGDDLRARLGSFAKDATRRIVPSHAMWECEEQATLWNLNADSIDALREVGIDRHFEHQPSTSSVSFEDAVDALAQIAAPHHLCLYRRGIPMLAMGEEQGPELTLIVDRADLEDLEAHSIGVEYEVLQDYFPDLFPDHPGQAPN